MTEARERIVVGIDGSEPSKDALRWALAEAGLRNAELELVHSWQLPTFAVSNYEGVSGPVIGYEDLEKEADELVLRTVTDVIGTNVPVPLSTVVRMGNAAEVLVAESKGATMLVVGARGRGGFTALVLGSVSSQVLHHARVPVVVVRQASAA